MATSYSIVQFVLLEQYCCMNEAGGDVAVEFGILLNTLERQCIIWVVHVLNVIKYEIIHVSRAVFVRGWMYY
jgi:hypothetical protein